MAVSPERVDGHAPCSDRTSRTAPPPTVLLPRGLILRRVPIPSVSVLQPCSAVTCDRVDTPRAGSVPASRPAPLAPRTGPKFPNQITTSERCARMQSSRGRAGAAPRASIWLRPASGLVATTRNVSLFDGLPDDYSAYLPLFDGCTSIGCASGKFDAGTDVRQYWLPNPAGSQGAPAQLYCDLQLSDGVCTPHFPCHAGASRCPACLTCSLVATGAQVRRRCPRLTTRPRPQLWRPKCFKSFVTSFCDA